MPPTNSPAVLFHNPHVSVLTGRHFRELKRSAGDNNNDVSNFATVVEDLIDVEVEAISALEIVDDEVQPRLNETKEGTAGDEPDHAAMDKGVGSEGVDPDRIQFPALPFTGLRRDFRSR